MSQHATTSQRTELIRNLFHSESKSLGVSDDETSDVDVDVNGNVDDRNVAKQKNKEIRTKENEMQTVWEREHMH